MYYHKDPYFFNKIFLPYEPHSAGYMCRRSICNKAVVYIALSRSRNTYYITIPDEYYTDAIYTEQEAMYELDRILIKSGCKLLSSIDDAGKYKILL